MNEVPGKTANTQYAGAIAAILSRVVGRSLDQLEPVPTYLDSIVYRGEAGGRSVLFKAMEPHGRDADGIGLEAWALERAAERGVPVPQLLACDLSGDAFPTPYLVMEQATGVPLSALALPRAEQGPYLRQLGRVLRLLHEEQIAGYGWLDEERYRREGAVRGLMPSWPAAVLDPLPSALSALTGGGALRDAQRSGVERIVAAGAPLLDRASAGRLLHGDLGPVHVWVDPGSAALTAIIDFGERASGDPIWEFVDYGPGVTEILEGYEPDAAMQAEFAEAFALYRLLRTIPWAARLYTRGVTHVMDWFHLSLRQAAERLGE